MKPPEQPNFLNLLEPNDELDKSLGNFSIICIIKFLTGHTGEKLYVTDTRMSGSRAQDDGLLRINDDKTLQVKSGRDWLALILYPGRYQLTPESLARYRELTKTVELQAAESGVLDDYLAAFAVSVRETRESPEKKAQRNFKTKLYELVRRKHITQWKTGITVSCTDEQSVIAECIAMARAAQFKIETLRRPDDKRLTYEAISGPAVGHILSNALVNNGYAGHADVLRQNDDRQRIGPHALVFNVKDGTLMILNKLETDKYRS